MRFFVFPDPMTATTYTPKKGQRICEELATGKSISAAMRAIGQNRSQYYNWRNAVDGFVEATDEAIEIGNDAIRDEVHRRAFDGSDTMLIFLSKARCPEFRDRQSIEMSGKDGAPFTIVIRRDDA
jgi:ACT domain-containing protein